MTTAPFSTPIPAAHGPERSARRDVLHLVVLVVPWAVFGWLWWRVGRSTSAAELLGAAGIVVLVATVCVPLTLLWVAHNLRIFRRKGERTGRPDAPFAYANDWTHREVVADWEAVRVARVVVVEPGADRKHFRPDDGPVVARPAVAPRRRRVVVVRRAG